MKKLVLLASIAIAMVIYQPAKAQVSVSINIGARPYYTPNYYSYYVPARPIYHQRTVVVHRPVYMPTRVYHSNYYRPVQRHYVVKHVKYHGNPHYGKGHGKGRH